MLAGGIRSDELASETPGESPHNDQRQKEKAPIGALSFCGESEHARGRDSKRRACKRDAGIIPFNQLYFSIWILNDLFWPLLTVNCASCQRGARISGLILFDTPQASVGIPTKLVSTFLFPFSSCATDKE